MSMPIQHTEECIRVMNEVDYFIRAWPNYCEHCGAYGVIHYPGTRHDPPDSQPCAHCIEAGKCPRCVSTNIDTQNVGYCDYYICYSCGWNELNIINNDPGSELMVFPYYECTCGMPTEEEEKYWEEIANRE